MKPPIIGIAYNKIGKQKGYISPHNPRSPVLGGSELLDNDFLFTHM